MIGSICFGIAVLSIVLWVVYSLWSGKAYQGHSIEYYEYLKNNGYPPPSMSDRFDKFKYLNDWDNQ